jgi:hypothetical protein
MDQSQSPIQGPSSTKDISSQSDIDHLSSRLASVFLEREATYPQPWTHNTGQWTHLTPGSSLSEQLRAIDNDPTTSSGEESLLASATQALDRNLANEAELKHAMDAYLNTLTDTQLSDLMSSTLHITPPPPPPAPSEPSPYTHYPVSPPSSPSQQFTGPFSSYPRGSLDAIKQLYIDALRVSEDPDVLMDAPLPGDEGELRELNIWMSELCAQCEIVIRSPRGHPECPAWV